MEPIVLGAPRSKEELGEELRRVSAACDAYWNHFPTEEFFAPIGSAWSPADNVRHLIKSMRPITFALRLPRFGLRALFGKARRPSRTLEAIRAEYARALANGGKAGAFAPIPRTPGGDLPAARARLMHRRATAEASLIAALARWTEKDLDAYRLPHPLIGKLTVREMILFTLYHGVHHMNNVVRRKGGTSS
jgi:hypothetical protein